MSADIVPIELDLTAGGLLTLWAPRWIEDGEEWEAFLGSGDHLYGFPEVEQLAAFIRGTDSHDLADHPEWEFAVSLQVDELLPADDARFDLVGVYELVAEQPDMWNTGELARIEAILRSLAGVCDLPAVDAALDASDGFQMCRQGPTAFIGRAGQEMWDEIGAAVASKWGAVIDALDALVITPKVDDDELARARAELASITGSEVGLETIAPQEVRDDRLTFWDSVGIDPISISVGGQVGYSLRCYLGQEPLFLSRDSAVLVFTKSVALEKFLADERSEHSMAELECFAPIRQALADREATVYVAAENRYALDDLVQQLTAGQQLVDIERLELAEELISDMATAFDDGDMLSKLSSSSELGCLISAIVRPDPMRLPPEPPFDAEAQTLGDLIEKVAQRLVWNPTRAG